MATKVIDFNAFQKTCNDACTVSDWAYHCEKKGRCRVPKDVTPEIHAKVANVLATPQWRDYLTQLTPTRQGFWMGQGIKNATLTCEGNECNLVFK